MTRIIMNGCNGKMGKVISELCKGDSEAVIAAGIDVGGGIQEDYTVYANLTDCDVEADVVIDFSSPKAMDALFAYCEKKHLPLVLCTTGLSEEQNLSARELSKKVAVLQSANMSLGINLLLSLIQEAAQILAPAGFDMEIIEKHHRQKVDAPSGTALALADSLNQALTKPYVYNYDRSKERQPRAEQEIGIQAVRGGTIVGEHEVIFAGIDEVISFSHTAYSKNIFAKGAVEAAKFLNGQSAGFYGMADVIGGKK
ncbi:4-hydroxy-tetrahydrodipicolinate reductase [Clostridia bacterium]|nr:4-hydroxy-tetrahydrodipicolinate reductase [Clostridia bacterium]